jgi:hypothetical protein
MLSTVVVIGACCLPVASFNPGVSNLHHVRLVVTEETMEIPRLIEVESSLSSSSSSSSSDAPSLVDEEDKVTTNTLRELPPVLQQITDERRNFQMNLGKAMDTLRKDMPYILKSNPGTLHFVAVGWQILS